MTATRISVSRLLHLRVPVGWQEAVEVALAADAMSAVRSLRVTLQNCLITTDGSVELADDGSDRIGPALSGLQLVEALLEGQDAPPELRALMAIADDPLLGFPSEQDAQAPAALGLEHFGRPHPEVEIARLARRGLKADHASVPVTADPIEQLRAEVSQLPPPTRGRVFEDWRAWSGRRPSPRLLSLAGAVAAIVLLGTLGRAVVAPSGSPVTADALAASEPEAGDDATAAGALDSAPEASPAAASVPEVAVAAAPATESPGTVDTARAAPSRVPAPSLGRKSDNGSAPTATTRPAPDQTAVTASGPRPRAQARTGALDFTSTPSPSRPASTVRLPPTPGLESPPLESRSAGSAGSADAPLDNRDPRADPREHRVYSHRDRDVEPPAMVRPQLPSEPKADSYASDSFLEVLVDERGQAVQVRLHSSDLSLNDRMIVAAAKAWQFRPALKDGRPVSYLLRVPITQ
ncbi:MAG: hypothetical protein OEW19_21415 [Acidobacteriota bacterium]|nr:hypothetical protein [Acidobacteriota bacterium]